ncbi:MAG: hypothetical protein ACRCSB_05220 [Bacteroidales bacterium]
MQQSLSVLLLGLLVSLLQSHQVYAQDNSSLNTYSPYTITGIGDIVDAGLTSTGLMGGISTAVRDSRQIDFTNPASATARDTLSFVFDLGGKLKNIYTRNNTLTTSYNTGNFQNITAAFSIWKFGINFGIVPYTQIGYEIERRELSDDIIANIGDVRYQYRGEDGFNQVFLNIGYNIISNLAVGIGGKFYFGNLSRYYNTIYNSSSYYYSTYSYNQLKVADFAPVIGAQYTLPLQTAQQIIFGLSIQPQMRLRTTNIVLSEVYSSAYADTVYNSSTKGRLLMPTHLSFGVTWVSSEKWMLGTEFNYQDWSKTEVLGRSDEMGTSYNIKLGGYYIPSFYDVRYFWKRWTYRAGLRYSQTPLMHNAYQVNDIAVTAGFSIPMRGAGMLTIGTEIGQRGKNSNNMLRETYVNFSLGLSLYEAWFVKYRYE